MKQFRNKNNSNKKFNFIVAGGVMIISLLEII